MPRYIYVFYGQVDASQELRDLFEQGVAGAEVFFRLLPEIKDLDVREGRTDGFIDSLVMGYPSPEILPCGFHVRVLIVSAVLKLRVHDLCEGPGVLSDVFHEDVIKAVCKTFPAQVFPPCRRDVRSVVYRYIARRPEPVRQVAETPLGDLLPLFHEPFYTRVKEIAPSGIQPQGIPPVRSGVEYPDPVSLPFQIPVKPQGQEGLPPCRKPDHYNGCLRFCHISHGCR